jgi:hypothetical protein
MEKGTASMRAFPRGASQRGAAAAAVAHREECRKADSLIAPLILELRSQGLSLRAIAKELTRRGIKTRQENRTWHARQVARILARAAGAAATPPTLPVGPANI